MDEEGALTGIVTIQDLDRALESGAGDDLTVHDIATSQNLVTAYDDEPMWTALRALGTRDVGRLPVIKRGAERELVGVVRRKDIIQAYNTAIIQRARHQSRSDRQHLGKILDSEFLELEIPANARVTGKRVSEIQLPEDCLIVSIQRGRKLYIAHGYSTLEVGDILTVISSESSVEVVTGILLAEK